jgi:sulfur-carrier protein
MTHPESRGISGVLLRLPSALADVAGGRRSLTISPAPATVAALLDLLDDGEPALARRLRDETGTLRRFVNVYVDGDDIRFGAGVATPLHDGAEVHVLPSVAGG